MLPKTRQKQLKEQVDSALKLTNGQMPVDIRVHTQEEFDEVEKMLKGRKHAAVVHPKLKTEDSKVTSEIQTEPNPEQSFEAALERFVHGCERITEAHRQEHYSRVPPAKFQVEDGRKYVKVFRDTSIHAFVAKESFHSKGMGHVEVGDVLKPASAKAPAKGARGNIFDDTNGLRRMGPFSPGYNKRRG